MRVLRLKTSHIYQHKYSSFSHVYIYIYLYIYIYNNYVPFVAYVAGKLVSVVPFQ